MPPVHPQVQKARDLMPLLAAASDENDAIRELTKPVVKALTDGGFFTNVADIGVTFVKDASGAVTHLILRQGGGEIEAKKIQ